ncbi:hypothetical protein JCM24511_02337 [Saitozyma sp. JCM 24511]|nr:hypothetical protein JCM24511_02337 [Saitozyma sp. JCM 24511]
MVYVPGIECLPDAALTRLLLEIFLSEFRCLHVPTFRQSCDEAALQSLTNPMSVDRAFLLALQCACLTVTLHLLDPDQLTLMGFDENRRSATSAAWSRVMTTTLDCADWMQRHRIESLQAFIIIGPYWCSIDRSEAYWAMLGTATKVAHSLGIHNLGTELGPDATYSQIRRHFGPRWVMAAARETGRRVWYSLVDLEIMSCSDHRWSSSHPLRFQWCARPANVDDDALIGCASVVSKPSDVYTSHCRSAERFLIHCDINSRLIKLHRIYLPGALLSKHYRLSRQASITHARQVLDALPRRPKRVSLRWWPLNLTVFSATVALFCVCVESRDSPDQQLVEATRQGVSWLSQSSATRAFEESAGALQTLLAEDLEMRGPSRQLSNLGMKQDSEFSAHRLLRQVLRFQSSQLAPSSATGATPQNVMGAQPSNDNNPFASSTTNDINFDFMGADQVPLTNDFFAAVGQDPFVFDWDAFPTVTEPEPQGSMNYPPADDLFGGTDVDILNVLRRTFPVDPRVMDDFFGQGSQPMTTGT